KREGRSVALQWEGSQRLHFGVRGGPPPASPMNRFAQFSTIYISLSTIDWIIYACNVAVLRLEDPLIHKTQPPWEFLLSASRNSLQSYELSRLSHAANLRKEIMQLLDS